MDHAALSSLFRVMGEPLRLRLLQLLAVEELSVGELVRVLDLPQSSVSRHLKALRESGLVADRPVGTATYYRTVLAAELHNGQTPLRDALEQMLADGGPAPADRARLDRVLALRGGGEEFFDRVGLRWDALREDCFGPTFHLEAFLHLLPREWTVADLGTGTGYLLPALGRQFRRVIGVDMSQPMLELARRRLAGEAETGTTNAKSGSKRTKAAPRTEAGFKNVELRHGTLESIPIGDGEVDLAAALLMLHHLADIEPALREIRRILKPGGRLLLVEIHPYTNERFRIAMADRRGGIDQRELKGLLRQTGFDGVENWDYPYTDHPEHELAPLPKMYGIAAKINI